MDSFVKVGTAVINTNNAAYQKAKRIRARRRLEGSTEEKVNDVYETLVMAMEEIRDLTQRVNILEAELAAKKSE